MIQNDDTMHRRRRGGLCVCVCVEVAGEVVGARDVREERTCFKQWTDRTTDTRGMREDDGRNFRGREREREMRDECNGIGLGRA